MIYSAVVTKDTDSIMGFFFSHAERQRDIVPNEKTHLLVSDRVPSD
jgi:hypothetical protein